MFDVEDKQDNNVIKSTQVEIASWARVWQQKINKQDNLNFKTKKTQDHKEALQDPPGESSEEIKQANPSAAYTEAGAPSQVPMCAAMCVATALGTPAIALMGLKLGLAAALGGGMMGFVTGRIFAQNEYVYNYIIIQFIELIKCT